MQSVSQKQLIQSEKQMQLDDSSPQLEINNQKKKKLVMSRKSRVQLEINHNQQFMIVPENSIKIQNLVQFPIKKEALNSSQNQDMIKHQFFSNLQYKNNQIEQKDIKYVRENDKGSRDTEYICKNSLQSGLNEEMTETTITNKPKYLNKLNNYKCIKLKPSAQKEGK